MTKLDDNTLLHPDIMEKIKKYFKSLNLEITRIDLKQGSKKGDNYLGVIVQVDIEGRTKTGELKLFNWIAKCAPIQPTFRKLANIEKCYAREVFLYKHVFPEFEELQKNKDISRPFNNFVPVHITCLEELKECLIMENMKAKEYVMKDRFQPLDLNHVMLVMREYGRYHALSFALKQQNPDAFNKLRYHTREGFFSYIEAVGFKASIDTNLSKAIESLDSVKHSDAIEVLEKLKPNAWDKFLEVLHPDAAGEYAVIGHGDSWVNNLLFQYNDTLKPETPTDLILLDWQLSRIGSPCLDLSYFIFTCTDKILRDEHFDDMLQQYYTSFSSFLEELGGNPETQFPKKVLEDHMKKFSFYGFIMTVVVLFLMMSESEEIPDWQNMELENIQQNMNYQCKNDAQFKQRIKGVVLDFYNKKYF